MTSIENKNQAISPFFSSKPQTLLRSVRVYRMTIASVWYDEDAQQVKEYEMHYKVAQGGAIRDTREYLAKRCVPHFQQTIYRIFKRWIPKDRIRVAFEREQPAIKTEDAISIDVRRMEGTGKRERWRAFPLPSKVLNYVKRSRKR
jgi:hypothetical protein